MQAPLAAPLTPCPPLLARAMPASAAQAVIPHALESTELLRGHKAVTIVHNGAAYRLQATRLGKLILTK